MDFVFVGLGGFVGALSRYSINLLEKKLISHSFPFGTLIINVLGCFIAGILLSRFENLHENRNLILLLVIGFTGSFTTFSTLMVDCFQLIQGGQYLHVFLNLFLSLSLGLVAVILGKSIFH